MKEKINKILVYIIFALIAVIVFCTVTAFLAKKAQFGLYRRKDPASVQEISSSKKSELNEFKEFGTLRVLTKSDDPDVSIGENLVITPWFLYKKGDAAFYEELCHKKKKIIAVFLDYFAGHTQKEILSLGEKKVKEELLFKINEQLVMGKISALYFDDYIFLK